MNGHLRSCLAVLLLSLPGLLQAATTPGLQVSGAWIREAPPGAPVLAGYMTITNNGTETGVVTSVSGSDFSAVEIHRTVIEEGVARMLSVERLEIPAGGTINLEPGSYHLMLFKPSRALVTGDSVGLLLHTGSGQCIAVEAPVLRHAADKHPRAGTAQ